VGSFDGATQKRVAALIEAGAQADERCGELEAQHLALRREIAAAKQVDLKS
jgi:hypothetical protein